MGVEIYKIIKITSESANPDELVISKEMKLFFIKGIGGDDNYDPILVLADTKEEAEKLAQTKKYGYKLPKNLFEDNSPNESGKAGKGYRLKKGVIWKQFNAG